MLPCASKQLLGMECPGCGLQRSFISLLQGHIADSFALYPGLVPLAVFFVLAFLKFTGMYKIRSQVLVVTGILVVLTVLGHYILKMAGMAPWYHEAEQHFHL